MVWCLCGAPDTKHSSEKPPTAPHRPGEAHSAAFVEHKQPELAHYTSRQAEVSVSSAYDEQALKNFSAELTQALVVDNSTGSKGHDVWGALLKVVELSARILRVQSCGVVIFTPSRKFCKAVVSPESPLTNLMVTYPDLIPAASMPLASESLCRGVTLSSKAGDDTWRKLQPAALDSDLILLQSTSMFAVSHPLVAGAKSLGALLLSHSVTSMQGLSSSLVTMLTTMVSLYVAGSQAVFNLGIVEKVVECCSLHSLAHVATSELQRIFHWCHKDGIETRLVTVTRTMDNDEVATVYSRPLPPPSPDESEKGSCASKTGSVATSMATSTATSSSSRAWMPGLSGSRDARGQWKCVLGTQLSLHNTLTKRCLTGRQRLLFVADVLQALKLYGEPWKDVFYDRAQVMTPAWVLAAPLVHEGKRLGAVIWLSASKLNPELLMKTASSSASLCIHAITRAMLRLGLHEPLEEHPSVSHASLTAPPLVQPTTLSREGTAGVPSSLDAALQFGHIRVQIGAEPLSAEPNATVPPLDAHEVLYHERKSPSTIALMRMYASTIAQQSSSLEEELMSVGIHEVRVVKKAGEGAFGAVYVGWWRGNMVAVKIIKADSGARALKTAWELAVNRSLSHPSIVRVHAILADVHLQKASSKVLRFFPAMRSCAVNSKSSCPQGIMSAEGGGFHLRSVINGQLSHDNSSSSSGDGDARMSLYSVPMRLMLGTHTSFSANGQRALVANLPCVHALIMEYCNLGGLHRYVDERRLFREPAKAPKGSDPPPEYLPPTVVNIEAVLMTLAEVASALQYLHVQGLVHCDLKPENVLLKEMPGKRGFTAKLADFGLSELRTMDGRVVGDLGGTVTHVAPESVLNRQVSPASDVYAFGILMWEMYTGQQPYRSLLAEGTKREELHRALLSKVVHEGLRPVFPKGVPPEYVALAQACWAHDPAQRPTTIELMADLDALMTGFAVSSDSSESATTMQPAGAPSSSNTSSS